MTSKEMRRAEELASDWLIDKKVVRFNLDKKEVHTQQPPLQADTAIKKPILRLQPLSQKTEVSEHLETRNEESKSLLQPTSQSTTFSDSTRFYDS